MKDRRVTQGVFLFGDRLLRLLVAVFSTALIARTLGAEQYGVFAQALLVLSILDIVTGIGIGGVIGARITQIPTAERRSFLWNAIRLRVLVASIFLCAGWLAITLYRGEQEVFGVGLLLTGSIGLLLNNWIIVEGFLNGIGAPEKAAICKSIVASVSLFARYLYIQFFDSSIIGFLAIFAAEQFLLTCMLIFCTPPEIEKDPVKKINLIDKGLFPYASVMWLSQLATLIYMKVDQVILSAYASSGVVGTYMLAIGLVELTYALPIIINAIFVSDIGVVRGGDQQSSTNLRRIMVKLYRYGFYSALLISTGLSFSSRILITTVYGDEYLPAVEVFNCLIFSLPWVTIGSIQLLTIYTGDDPKIHLKKTITMAVISPALAVLGWSLGGAPGLGVSVVITQVVGCFLLNHVFDRPALVSQSEAIFFIGGNKRGI